jgi:hypothetical protein
MKFHQAKGIPGVLFKGAWFLTVNKFELNVVNIFYELVVKTDRIKDNG